MMNIRKTYLQKEKEYSIEIVHQVCVSKPELFL